MLSGEAMVDSLAAGPPSAAVDEDERAAAGVPTTALLCPAELWVGKVIK